METRTNYKDSESYIASKRKYVETVARHGKEQMRATWCLAESGTCGPDFRVPGVTAGFTALAVCGPVERVKVIRTDHADRIKNMWTFAKAALELLEECVEASKPTAAKL